MQCNAMSRMNGTVPYAWVHSSVVQQWSLAVPTLDAFQLLHDAQKHGARAALFGRKINQAENQLAFVETLRHVADRLLTPVEAVKAYHSELTKQGLKPHRSLADDLT